MYWFIQERGIIKHTFWNINETLKMQRPTFNENGMTQWNWMVKYHQNFELGDNTEIGAFTLIDAYKGVQIEDNVKIGFGAKILSHSSIDQKSGKVILKQGCSVGANTVVLPGVTIGEGAIVGAQSLVTKDIPPNEVWFGSPARFYKKKWDGNRNNNSTYRL